MKKDKTNNNVLVSNLRSFNTIVPTLVVLTLGILIPILTVFKVKPNNSKNLSTTC